MGDKESFLLSGFVPDAVPRRDLPIRLQPTSPTVRYKAAPVEAQRSYFTQCSVLTKSLNFLISVNSNQ